MSICLSLIVIMMAMSASITEAFCHHHLSILPRKSKTLSRENSNSFIAENRGCLSPLLSSSSSSAEEEAISIDDISDGAENEIFKILGDGRITLSKEEEEKLDIAIGKLKQHQEEQTSTAKESLLIGKWKLLYTTKSKFDISNPLGRREDGTTPGLENIFPILFGNDKKKTNNIVESSSSPIQRLVTNLESIDIYQNILSSSNGNIERVDQLVKNDKDETLLRLSASGRYNITKKRINFSFDLAYFNVFGVRVPYPVPFQLLGDEAKGYLDTKVITSNLRVSTGNKGTSFILRRIID